MRFIRLLSLAGTLVVSATVFVGGERATAPTNAQQPAKEDKKPAAKQPEEKKSETGIDKLDDEILRRAKVSTEGDALVEFFKKRGLSEKERPEVERLVRRLDAADYRVREKASLDLIERGVHALDVLRHSTGTSADCEKARRIERAIQTIRDKDVGPAVPAAAARVASLRKPNGLVEALIGYVPFADNDAVYDELRFALKASALKDGKADPHLLAALADRSPSRRAMAAEVLGRIAYAENKDALRKLLADPDAIVRYRLARALVLAQQRDAIPVLIDTLADLPINAAWQAEDFLLKLTTTATAPPDPMGNDKDAREKCKAGWQEWWKKHGEKVDLTRLEDTPRMLGRTLVVLLDRKSVIDLGPDNLPRFEITGLQVPLDAQMIDEDRVLIAEHEANRVSERNSRGEILWQKALGNGGGGGGGFGNGPQVAQRLPNGNTFIATANQLLEFDKDDNLVVNIRLAEGFQQKIMKAMKLPNGEIVCMQNDSTVVRYDSKGTELHSFPIKIGMRLFGGRVHVLPNGRILVPHHAEGKVVEYDSRGKIVWEVLIEQPIVATRLPNGNTLITSMDRYVGAVEVDRTGAHVWSYQHPDPSSTRVTRAIRR